MVRELAKQPRKVIERGITRAAIRHLDVELEIDLHVLPLTV